MLLGASCHFAEAQSPLPLPSPETTAALLRQWGLTRRQEVWEQSGESRARRQLAELAALRQQVLALRRSIAALQESHQLAGVAARRRLSLLQAQLARGDDPEARSQLRQLEQLIKESLSQEQVGARPDVIRESQQLIDAELSMLEKTLELQRALPRLESRRAELSRDPEVTRALRRLGHQLSDPPSWTQKRLQIQQWQDLAGGPEAPMYLQNGQVRIGALLQDQAPVTLTWREDAERHWITQSMAEAAGLSAEGPRSIITPAPGRAMEAASATCRLRIGPAVWVDLTVWVLPSEGEDLGGQLGGYGLAPWRLAADPAALKVRITRP